MGDIQKYEQAIRTVFNYSCLCSQHSPQSKSTSAGKLITFTVLSHRAVPHLSPHCTWGHIWEMLSTRAGKEKQVRRAETRAEGAAVSLKWRRGDVSPLLSADHWLNQEDFWHQQKSSGTSISSGAVVEQEWGSWAELNEEPKEPGWKSQYPGGMGCWREKGAKWGQKWQGTRVLEAKNSKTRDQWEKHGIKKRSEVANIAERKEKQRKLLQWIWGEGTDSQPKPPFSFRMPYTKLWMRTIFLLLLMKQIETFSMTKATEAESALAREQMGLKRPWMHLKWKQEVQFWSSKGQKLNSVWNGAFIKGIKWCDHPQRQGTCSRSPKDPHGHSQIPLILLSFPLPATRAFMDSAAPRFKSKV